MFYVKGRVLDEYGQPLPGVTVRAYRRDTGSFLSETVSVSQLTAPDPYLSNVVLLLPMTGADDGKTFFDYSATGASVTPYGDAHTETDNAKTASSSLYLDGSGDYLVVPTNPKWVLSGVKFTVEAWVYPMNLDASNNKSLIHSGTYGINDPWGIGLRTNGLLCTPGANPYQVSATIANNQWHHVVLESDDAQYMKFYLNGVQQGARSSRGMYGEQSALAVGAFNQNNPSGFLKGYIQDLRITRGHARYGGNYTPPALPHSPFPYSLLPGEYGMLLPYAGEVQLVALDLLDANLLNDLILRVTPAT